MEKPTRARRRKPETDKADLQLHVQGTRRAGCPERSGIRRACGEALGRNQGGDPEDEPVGQWWERSSLQPRAKAFSFAHHSKVIADGTTRKNSDVTSGELIRSADGTAVSEPISTGEKASEAGSAVGRPE